MKVKKNGSLEFEFHELVDDNKNEVLTGWLAQKVGKARERVTDVDDLIWAVEEAKALKNELGVLDKTFLGKPLIVCRYAQRFPRAYKYSPKGDYLILTQKSRYKWEVNIERRDCNGKSYSMIRFCSTADMQEVLSDVLNSKCAGAWRGHNDPIEVM